MQALFIGTVAWDFFLTILTQSIRSHIFTGMPAAVSMMIIIPWILGIFILLAMLLIFMINKDTDPLISNKNFEYGGMALVYIILFFIGLFNPLIPWPIVLNYLLNIVWAGSLICFRIAILRGLTLGER